MTTTGTRHEFDLLRQLAEPYLAEMPQKEEMLAKVSLRLAEQLFVNIDRIADALEEIARNTAPD